MSEGSATRVDFSAQDRGSVFCVQFSIVVFSPKWNVSTGVQVR